MQAASQQQEQQQPPAIIYCVSCQTLLSHRALGRCYRCGADNRAWGSWLQASWKAQAGRFFFRNPWGLFALISLWLPPLSWLVFDFNFLSLETLILFTSLLLSIISLTVFFLNRHKLWLDELTRQVASPSQIGLSIGGGGFLIFIAVGILLAIIWSHTDWSIKPLFGDVILLAVAFTSQTVAAGLYAVYAHGRWLIRSFPKPIFVDRSHLLQVATQSVNLQLRSQAQWVDATILPIHEARYTQRAGLHFKLRCEKVIDNKAEGCSLKMAQEWRVISDKWGGIITLSPNGPLIHQSSLDQGEVRQRVEGEIIFPKSYHSQGCHLVADSR